MNVVKRIQDEVSKFTDDEFSSFVADYGGGFKDQDQFINHVKDSKSKGFSHKIDRVCELLEIPTDEDLDRQVQLSAADELRRIADSAEQQARSAHWTSWIAIVISLISAGAAVVMASRR